MEYKIDVWRLFIIIILSIYIGAFSNELRNKFINDFIIETQLSDNIVFQFQAFGEVGDVLKIMTNDDFNESYRTFVNSGIIPEVLAKTENGKIVLAVFKKPEIIRENGGGKKFESYL